MLAIGIHYLTGYAVATDTGNRQRAEWPPHPGRIFMALAAAYFETKPESDDDEAMVQWEAEGEALRWLEGQPAPELVCPEATRRDVVDVFVPPNDMGTSKRTIIPAFRSNRQPRTFPKVRLPDGEDSVWLRWPGVDCPCRSAFDRLCRKVIRIGHSSSLVHMWLAETDVELAASLRPVESVLPRAEAERLRVVGPGCINYLKAQYNGEAVEAFYEFAVRIDAAKGKAKEAAKADFKAHFGYAWKASLPAPRSQRPRLSITQAYRRVGIRPRSEPLPTVFDDTLLVLDKREGPALGLETTWRVLTALRGAIETRCQPTPEWVSGHQPGGAPSENPHLALLPLAFVGADHADGHLMGVALAFPREVLTEERGALLGRLFYDATGQEQPIKLTLGDLGSWTLQQEDRASPPRALRSETWTRPATHWASISPVVLDRHPKADPAKPEERLAYIMEVQEIIAESCHRIGLPAPAEIDIDKTSWHVGAPRAKPGPDGYPLMPIRPGGPNRRQVHVWLRFDAAVRGPVLLGAGRYRGYGLCKPWTGHHTC